MATQKIRERILGIDLGSNSIGWALLQYDDGQPTSIIDCGVRVFEAGMDGNIDTGQAESRAINRREKRATRRMTARRQRRKSNVLHQLQRMGLLPQGDAGAIFPSLDQQLLTQYREGLELAGQANLDNLLPYWLRARALDQKLSPEELGRALYHLAQRRGFLSNRKTPEKKDDDAGKVKEGIAQLASGITDFQARTLGEYFAKIDPTERRIRQRYTHRDMFKHEFDAIWAAQCQHHPNILTDDNYKRLFNTIFHQRPLRSAKGLVGKCELEPSQRRAPWASIEAQQFRYVQIVNNCSLAVEGIGDLRPLDDTERAKLLNALERQGDLTFAKAKKILGFKSKEARFNFEDGSDKGLKGNRISKALAADNVFGEAWFELPRETQEAVIHDLVSIREQDVLARRAQKAYGLDPDAAQAFSEIEPEPGYANLSKRAISKLLPLMKQGVHYATACKEVYGEIMNSGDILDLLPPAHEQFDLKNPVVTRSLTELRKVVNGLILEHGKPDKVNIELAREIKNSQAKRQEITKRNNANRRSREKAAQKIVEETSITNPRGDDILKVLLADECDWMCPYTGKPISMNDLFGPSPKFDIEHIIPFSRSLDDSFNNKTLCYHEENRHIKTNKTPYEAYHGTSQWGDILARVSRFTGPSKLTKLRRFQLPPEELGELDDFVARQLNDTRYASKLAMQYLGSLYGGVHRDGKRHVFAVTGAITAYLRQVWDLNAVLGDGSEKNRNDHRHHAVDAAAIALTNPGTIQMLTAAALPAHERKRYRGRFQQPDLPWPTFHADVQTAIDNIVVSHRVDHTVNTALHAETIYAEVTLPNGQRGYHVRKELKRLKPTEIKQITDSRIAKLVQDKLDDLGQTDPSKAFSSLENHPCYTTQTGKTIGVHRVTIRTSVKNTKSIASGDRQRQCTTDTNHHMEVLAVQDADGNITKWEGVVVDTLEAMQRVRKQNSLCHKLIAQGMDKSQARKQARQEHPVIQRDHGPGKQFLFSLCTGDALQLDNPKDDIPSLVVVRSIWMAGTTARLAIVDLRCGFKSRNDAHNAGFHFSEPRINVLRKLQPRKVMVLPTGKLIPAND